MATTINSTLSKLPKAFAEARGRSSDRQWAELVIGRLSLDGINTTLIAAELTQVLALVRESGEGPHGLFGDASDYAQNLLGQWRVDGAPVEPVEPDTSWRDVPVVAAVMATFVVVMLAVLELLSGNWTTDFTIGKILLPALSALTTLVSITTFETLLMRARRLYAVAGALAVAGSGVLLIAATFVLGNDHPLLTGPLWWYAGLIVLYALATIAVSRWFPDGDGIRTRRQAAAADDPGTAATSRLSDEQWAAELAGVLRLRAELPEKEVRATIAEARQHAAGTGTSLVDEFGLPGEYASRVPRSAAARRRRRRWNSAAFLLGAVISGYLGFGGLQDGLAWGNVYWPMATAFLVFCFAGVLFLLGRKRYS
ncbi:hypothetical protein E8P82_07125 [Arthrobacter echini]|uniref:Uncharacterized protein n=1 Tax=Arthrobacter echini TaxID=1529066 RepID=A0A4S5E5J6_9MICC|nr:hypothetical protein [Arthrobacter echini]THJ66710.1 hypothetical protein E8P82_07125 [Arthrobacter echini]